MSYGDGGSIALDPIFMEVRNGPPPVCCWEGIEYGVGAVGLNGANVSVSEVKLNA